MDDLITVREAARLVRTHVSCVYRWIGRGQLPAWRRGPYRLLVRKGDVLRMLEPVGAVKPVEPKVDLSEVEAAKERLRKLGVKC